MDELQTEVEELLANTSDVATEQSAGSAEVQSAKKSRVFQKYKIKDIVFLAIITACTLVTGAGSILNPKIFYRAFLIPFVTRLPTFSVYSDS